MAKYSIVVRAWGTSGSKYYNDYRTGDILLFNNRLDAVKFLKNLKKHQARILF